MAEVHPDMANCLSVFVEPPRAIAGTKSATPLSVPERREKIVDRPRPRHLPTRILSNKSRFQFLFFDKRRLFHSLVCDLE